MQKEELDEAISSYQKAIQLKPDMAGVYKKLGDIFVKQEQLDTAVLCYQKTLDVNPEATHIYSLLGNVFAKQGKESRGRNIAIRGLFK